MRDRTSMHMARTRLVAVENTHNSSGGRCWRLEELDDVVSTARELDLKLHLDGARLLNAATAAGIAPAEYGRRFDTVTLLPLQGPRLSARRHPRDLRRARMEGAARQASDGRRDAPGGHRRGCRRLRARAQRRRVSRTTTRVHGDSARRCHEAGVPVDLEQVETNFVQVDAAPLGLTRAEAMARMKEAGVLLSTTVWPTKLRAVTHLDVDDDDIDAAIDAIPRALGALARV